MSKNNANSRNHKEISTNYDNKRLVKVFGLSFILLIGLEGVFDLIDNTGNLNIEVPGLIPYKCKESSKLFSQNQDRIKVVMLGDSRAIKHINPIYFDAYFNNDTISYNMGVYSSSIFLQNYLLKNMIIPKLQPDLIIWEINYGDFFNDTYEKDKPLINNNKQIIHYYGETKDGLNSNEIFQYYLTKYSWIHRIGMIKIQDQLESDKIGLNSRNFEFNRGHEIVSINRFKENYTGMTIRDINSEYGDIYDKRVEEEFLSAILLLESYSIPYLIIYGPYAHNYIEFDQMDNLIESLPQINLLNLNGNTDFVNSSWYYDSFHLNSMGNPLYNNYLCQKIEMNKSYFLKMF